MGDEGGGTMLVNIAKPSFRKGYMVFSWPKLTYGQLMVKVIYGHQLIQDGLVG